MAEIPEKRVGLKHSNHRLTRRLQTRCKESSHMHSTTSVRFWHKTHLNDAHRPLLRRFLPQPALTLIHSTRSEQGYSPLHRCCHTATSPALRRRKLQTDSTAALPHRIQLLGPHRLAGSALPGTTCHVCWKVIAHANI